MQEPTFLILTALAAGPQHGYGIIIDAGRTSGGVTRLQTGTLYMALDPAPGPARAALERRYRRLLRCYPPGHREEMLGWLVVVLLGLTARRRAAAAMASVLLALALALTGCWTS